MQYKEIIKEMKLIKNTKFNNNTLRDLQILTKKINFYIKHQYLTNVEILSIYTKMKKLISNKLTELNAPKIKNLTNNLLPILNQNYNKIPTDITIIDNDLILLYNKPYDTPIIKDEIQILKSKNYKELTEQYSQETFNSIYEKLNAPYDFETKKNLWSFYFPSNEDYNYNEQSINTIVKNINVLLSPYNNYLDKTIDIDTKKTKMTYPKNSTMKIFINKPLKDIIKAIFKNETISFNLIATNEWNEIYCYEITQYSPKNKTFTFSWNIERTNLDIWTLSNSIEKEKVLTKKKNDNK